MSDKTEKALDEIAEEQRTLVAGLEAEVKEDVQKARGGEGAQPKRPWWKVWART
jgi:hypothetical protein